MIVLLCAYHSNVFAQKDSYKISFQASYLLPIGTFADRFDATTGGAISFGKQISEEWTWSGIVEYFKFGDTNEDNLNKTFEAEIGGEPQLFTVPLEDLDMEFESYGLAVEAKYHALNYGFLKADMHAAFGFYHWENVRGAYYDSVMVDTTGTGELVKIWNFEVPENKQEDWSGVFTIGADLDVKLFEPVWFTINANYKLIIGELWPALALDLENVSGIQMFQIRSGLKVTL